MPLVQLYGCLSWELVLLVSLHAASNKRGWAHHLRVAALLASKNWERSIVAPRSAVSRCADQLALAHQNS